MFNVGDLVCVLNGDLCYGTYESYFKHHDIEHLKEYWSDSVKLNTASLFEIIFKGKHEYDNSELCIIKNIHNGRIFIIENFSETLKYIRSNIIKEDNPEVDKNFLMKIFTCNTEEEKLKIITAAETLYLEYTVRKEKILHIDYTTCEENKDSYHITVKLGEV